MRLWIAALLAAGSLILVPMGEAAAQTKIIVKKRAAPQSYLSTARTGQPQTPNAQRVSVHSSTPLWGTTYGNSPLQSRYPLPGPFDLPGKW